MMSSLGSNIRVSSKLRLPQTLRMKGHSWRTQNKINTSKSSEEICKGVVSWQGEEKMRKRMRKKMRKKMRTNNQNKVRNIGI